MNIPFILRISRSLFPDELLPLYDDVMLSSPSLLHPFKYIHFKLNVIHLERKFHLSEIFV